jgi:phospholipase C
MRRALPCAVLALALLGLPAAGTAAARGPRLQPPPARTPIAHVISLMQEDHSFDNYFGTYPGAHGIPSDTCMPVDPHVPGGRCIRPFHIDNSVVEDLSGSPQVARAQINGGRMDGFVSAIAAQRGRVQPVVMGHYDDRDIPFYWNVADRYVLFDRFFSSAAGGSVTNHMFWVTGGPGDKHGESIPNGGFHTPTIFDRLEASGLSWKFYVQNYDPQATFRTTQTGQVVWAPLLAYARFVDDPKLFSHIVPLDQLPLDMQRGTLPAVSYVVSSGAREHPPGSLKAGQTLVRTLITDLMRSRYWTSSMFTWTYDVSGGWYDHVVPPRVDAWGDGLRVPALLVSAYARRGFVDHTTLDFTSILKFIEDNWGLRPLTERDRHAGSLLGAFDFARPPRRAQFITAARRAPPAPKSAGMQVYVSYGGGAMLALLAILLAVGREALVRRGSPRLRGPSNRITIGPWGER